MPDYEVDGHIFMERHYEGGYIYRKQIIVEAFPDASEPAGWRVKYGFQDTNPGKPGVAATTKKLVGASANAGVQFAVPIEQKARPGIVGNLRIEVRPWQ